MSRTFGSPRSVRGWVGGWSRSVELVQAAVAADAIGWVVREGARRRIAVLTRSRGVTLMTDGRSMDVGELGLSRESRSGLVARWYVDGELRIRELGVG
jgi:hypothetical protein